MPKDGDRWKDEDLFSHDDWCEIIDKVNGLKDQGTDECPEFEELECPEKPHIWTKTDIEEVQNVLTIVCDENEWDEFEDPQLWTAEILNKIEDAIEEGWCNCCWECPDAKPGPSLPHYEWTDGPLIRDTIALYYTSNEDRLDQEFWEGPPAFFPFGDGNKRWYDNSMIPGWNGIYDPDGRAQERGAIYNEILSSSTQAAGGNYAWNLWRTAQAGWDKVVPQVEEELERAEDRLEELEETRDEICAEVEEDPSRQGACDNANELVDDQQEDVDRIRDNVDQIKAELQRVTGKAEAAWAEIEAGSAANNAAAHSYPPFPGGQNLAGLVGENPGHWENWWDPEMVRWGGDEVSSDDWMIWLPRPNPDEPYSAKWGPTPKRCSWNWGIVGARSGGGWALNGTPTYTSGPIQGKTYYIAHANFQWVCGIFSAAAGLCALGEPYGEIEETWSAPPDTVPNEVQVRIFNRHNNIACEEDEE